MSRLGHIRTRLPTSTRAADRSSARRPYQLSPENAAHVRNHSVVLSRLRKVRLRGLRTGSTEHPTPFSCSSPIHRQGGDCERPFIPNRRNERNAPGAPSPDTRAEGATMPAGSGARVTIRAAGRVFDAK